MTDIPQVLKDALYSPETVGAIKVIGDKNKLLLDVVGEIEAFVNLRIMGAIDDNDFMKGVRTSVKESKVADTVITDINTTIFGPLRAKLNASTETVKLARAIDEMPAAVHAGPAPIARMSGTQVKEVRTIDVTMPSRRLLEEPKVPAVVEVAPKAAVVTSSETFPPRPEAGEGVAIVAVPTLIPTPREEIPILKQNVSATTPAASVKAAPSTRAPELIKTGAQYKEVDPYHEPI